MTLGGRVKGVCLGELVGWGAGGVGVVGSGEGEPE